MMHDPEVLIMDEPTDGLDPNQKQEVRELIRGMAPGKATVLSTHILEEVQAVCTRVIIIARGRIVFDGTPAQLGAKSRHHNAVSITVRGGSRVREELERLEGVASVQEVSRDGAAAAPSREGRFDGVAANGRLSCMIFPKGGRSLVDEVARHARGRGWEVDELRVETGRLDDVFRELTAGAAGGRS
jgi:ABC-2 type transport system ATP-binding protein